MSRNKLFEGHESCIFIGYWFTSHLILAIAAMFAMFALERSVT